MGVKGLWRLLLPIGRRINVETLEGKVLAIDASIWLTQFIKAMRDPETGSVKPSAHLIGFFRRLAKLRFHGIKPVLVFDGATPEIKLRELAARRQRRDQFAPAGQQGIQRLAKRLLVQELKKLKGGTKEREQGGMAATFNLPEEELKGKTKGANEIDENDFIPSHIHDDVVEHNTSQETSEEIARALQEAEWNQPNDEDEQAENDWDVVVKPCTTSLEHAASLKSDNHSEEYGIEDPKYSLQRISSMSAHARKDAIEDLKRQQRLLSRREFMPVAGQPQDYSQVQVRNFLRSSRLNQTIVKWAKDTASNQNHRLGGEAIASDATRRILFEKFTVMAKSKRLIIKPQEVNQFSDSEEEIWVEETKGPKKILDSDDEAESGGGFIQEGDLMISTSPPKRKRIVEGDSDDASGDEGFLVAANRKAFTPIHEDTDTSEDDGGGGFLSDRTRVTENSESGNLMNSTEREAQEVEDEMLARALQDSENSDKVPAATKAPVEAREMYPDKVFARQIQHSDRKATQGSTVAESDDVIVINDDDDVDRKLPAKSEVELTKVDSDGEDDIDWEDGDVDEVELAIAPPLVLPLRVACTENEDDLDWEEGERNDDKDVLSNEANKESIDVDIYENNDFHSTNKPNLNNAALEQAQATAAKLTDWAGRAFRRAMVVHAEETGGTVQNADSISSKPPVNEVEVHMVPLKGVEGEITSSGKRVEAFEAIEKRAHIQLGEDTGPNHELNISMTAATRPADIMSSLPPMDLFQSIAVATLLNDEDKMESERRRQERDMETVTDEMKAEIIHLIRLFGIPYVEAPAEAEAQCVALEELGLVDGIVTEDSDVFVFGGKTIYRNIFDDQKYVEVYSASDAQRDLALARNQFVGLAMLLGGDYTDGVKGVGIVNGMEILQAFDLTKEVKAGLVSFRKWLDGFDPGDAFGCKGASDAQTIERKFHIKHRSARQRWSAPTNFPSDAVLNAYLNPVVDKCEDPFSWGTPDLDALVDFCQRNMGWETGDTAALVEPVLQRMNAGMRQTRIESFFMKYEDNIKFANVKSKRLREVFEGFQLEKKNDGAHESSCNSDDENKQIKENENLIVEVETKIDDDDNEQQAPPKRRKLLAKRGRPRGVK